MLGESKTKSQGPRCFAKPLLYITGCNCGGYRELEPRNTTIILWNFIAATAHLIAFAVLAYFVVDNEIQLERNLSTKIAGEEPERRQRRSANGTAVPPGAQTPVVTTANDDGWIYDTDSDYGRCVLRLLYCPFLRLVMLSSSCVLLSGGVSPTTWTK